MILANGCSHTAGSESSVHYPGLVAGRMNMRCVNIAHPGGSNHRILRSTLEWLESNAVPELVIIGWSTHERFELPYKGEWLDYTSNKSSDSVRIDQFYRYLDLYCADWNRGLEATLTYQLSLSTYLESRNINYIFCNMFNSIPAHCQHPVWQALNKAKYYQPHSSFIERLRDLHHRCFSSTVHGNEFIHECIADELYKFIEENTTHGYTLR